MQVRSNITYGVSMSSVSRRRKRRRGWGKKFLAILVVLLFIGACVTFVKSGILDVFSRSSRVEGYLTAGDKLLANGDYKGAMEQYDMALDKDSDHPDANAAKGDALAGLKKYDDALKFYTQALKNSDKCVRAYTGLINLSVDQGNAKDARMWLGKAKDKGVMFKNGQWSLLEAPVPGKSNLVIADNDCGFADGTVKIKDSEVVYIDADSAEEKVIYVGAPSHKFASDGVSVYIYDSGTGTVAYTDIATGLHYTVYEAVGTSFDSNRFCGIADDRYLYFSEKKSDDGYITKRFDTKDNSVLDMDGVDIKSIIKKDDGQLIYLTHTDMVCICSYDGSDKSEVAAYVRECAAVKGGLIIVETAQDDVVNVFRYDLETKGKTTLAQQLNVITINEITDGYMSYYTKNKRGKTTIELLYF